MAAADVADCEYFRLGPFLVLALIHPGAILHYFEIEEFTILYICPPKGGCEVLPINQCTTAFLAHHVVQP